MLGNSDIHAPDLNEVSTPEDHRTLTLVFAKERTLEGLQDALREGRTVVWYQDKLIGPDKWLRPLIDQCVHPMPIRNASGQVTALRIVNDSVVPVQLKRISGDGPDEVVLEPESFQRLPVSGTAWEYEATNLLVAPGKGLVGTYSMPGPH